MDFSGYPRCANGDVLIKLSHDKIFQVHANILKRHSKFFRDELKDGGASLSSTAKRNKETVRWRFDLVERPAEGEQGCGVLSQVHLDSNARPLPHSRLVYTDMTQSGTGKEQILFSHYDKVFGAMYGLPFELDSSNKAIEELLEDVVSIIYVAQYLGCVPSVAHTLNSALLGQGQVLWRAVKANPICWIDMAMRVRSVAVFTEAAIHITGRWSSLTDEDKESLDPKARKFCEEKYKQLQKKLMATECKVLKFYPPDLTRPLGAPPNLISRMNYSNDIFMWMALCLFRHWFASILAVDANRRAPDGGYWLFSCLAKGGDAYLEKKDVNGFHEKFPMSTRGEHVLDGLVDKIKEMIRPIAAQVMKTELCLDAERYPVEYLTCVVVEKGEVQKLLQIDDEAEEWGTESMVMVGNKKTRKHREMQADDEELEELNQMMVVKKRKVTNRAGNGAREGIPSLVDDDESDEIDSEEELIQE